MAFELIWLVSIQTPMLFCVTSGAQHNISIRVESCFCSFVYHTSIVRSPFSSVLVSSNSRENTSVAAQRLHSLSSQASC